ncbi:MAG: hypothetical protein WKF79_04645 [Nocardioides sp.]
MPEHDDQPTRDGHPVLSGFAALVAVALVVGLILGFGALAGSRVLGLGDSDGATSRSTAQDSMYLPRPEPTESASGPLITLAPDTEGPISQFPSPTTSPSAASGISLSAGQTETSPMGQIDLTGVYPGGEGAILQVQQYENGGWDDFPVTASVSNETFGTYVQTGQLGLNRFRMIDTDSGLSSNEVRVTITG